MEKRTLLAIVLMAVVLALSQYFLAPSHPTKQEDEAASSTTPAAAPTTDAAAPPAVPAGAAARQTTAGAYAAPGGGSLSVETPLYDLTLDRKGGVITRISLKRYPSFVDEGAPVQLVPPGLAFFQRSVRGAGQELDLTDVEFEADRPNLRVTDRRDSLVLTGRTPAGATLVQAYVFDPATYTVDYRLDADGAAPPGHGAPHAPRTRAALE